MAGPSRRVMEAQALNRRAVAEIAAGLERRGWRLGVAESCTGGLVSHLLTERAGISRVLLGGVVAYSNRAKERLLGVSASQLAAAGAVSAEVVRAMASGAAHLFGADCAVAVSGIAGPGGATERKPVGTVWIGWCWPGGAREERHQFAGSRSAIKRQAATAALAGLREAVREAR